MLLWLVKLQSSKIKHFQFKIFILSIVFHLILLSFCLFINYNNVLKFEIKNNVRNSGVPIVFLPLTKNVYSNSKKISKTDSVKKLANNLTNKVIVQEKITVQTKSQNIKENKTNVASVASIPKIVVEDKPKKQNEKQNKLKQEVEKKLTKNIENVNKTEKILNEEKLKNNVNEIKKEQAAENLQDTESIKQEGSKEELINSDNAIYLGRRDFEQFEIELVVNNEIKKNWNPPPGLSKKLKTLLSCYVNFEGRAENIQIKEKSKSIAYDMSAKKSIEMAHFPKEVWGRVITPQFGPEEL